MSSNGNSNSNRASNPNPAAAAAAAAVTANGSGAKKETTKGHGQAPAKKKVRRKKPPAVKGPSSQAIVAAARNASGELNALKAAEASKLKDPLWYRANEVLQAISGDASPVPGLLAEQVDLVEAALHLNHLTRADLTPQAFGVLLEQARRFALEVVADAQDCAYAAHRHDVTRADIMMALELRPDQANTHTLGELQKMNLVAHNLNRIPIPPIPSHCFSGVVLPPQPHQLTSRTFDIITGAHTAFKMNQPLPSLHPQQNSKASTSIAATAPSTKTTPSYGASRGRLIPITLQTKTAVAPSTQSPAVRNTPTVPTPAAVQTAPTTTTSSVAPSVPS